MDQHRAASFLSDPEPLTEFKIKVSLSDLKVAEAIWGSDGYNVLVSDLLIRVRQQIREAVDSYDFDTKQFTEEE